MTKPTSTPMLAAISMPVIVAFFSFATLAVAETNNLTLTYTIEGTGLSGTLDGTQFADASAEITMTGDTSNIVQIPTPGQPRLLLQNPASFSTGTVTVAGVGTDTLPVAVQVNQNAGNASFVAEEPGRPGNTAAIWLTGGGDQMSVFQTYALGLIAPTSGAFSIFNGSNFETALGTFNLNGNFNTAATFSSSEVSISEIPLPAALPLFATGLGGLGLLGRRRKRRARGVT